MRRSTVFVILGVFLLVLLVPLFSKPGGGPSGPATVSTPSGGDTPQTVVSGTSSAATSFSPRVVEYDSLYTVSTPAGRVVVGVRADPGTVSVAFTTVVRDGVRELFSYLTIRYVVSGGTTTEVVVTGGLLTTRTFTAVGVGSVAVIRFGSSVSTDSKWVPLVFRVFAPFSPYVVRGSTTYFTMGGDVLETVTLTEWGTVARISHVYTRVVGGSTFERTVVMTGVMRGFSTVVSLPVYTDFPGSSYPWISGGRTVLPVFLVSGVLERERTVVGGTVTNVETEFYSVMGSTVPTSFVGYQGGVVTSVSGTAAVVYYGSIALTGSLVGGGFVVTVSDMLSSGAPVRTTTVTDFMGRFYLFRTLVGVSSILVDGTPVVVASYAENGMTFVITYGRDFAVVRGAYKVFTGTGGGFVVFRTFAMYGMGVVGVTGVG